MRALSDCLIVQSLVILQMSTYFATAVGRQLDSNPQPASILMNSERILTRRYNKYIVHINCIVYNILSERDLNNNINFFLKHVY